MSFLVRGHAFQEAVHPELPISIRRAYTHSIELTDIRAKDHDRGIVLMHGNGELNKGLNVFSNRKWLACAGIDEYVRFAAHRPELDGMERGMCILALTQVTPRVVHVVYPATRQAGPVC